VTIQGYWFSGFRGLKASRKQVTGLKVSKLSSNQGIEVPRNQSFRV
jgi:hypothetical protein